MKVYKKYKTAHKAARGRPIIQIGKYYLVANLDSWNSVQIIRNDDVTTSYITLKKLDSIIKNNESSF